MTATTKSKLALLALLLLSAPSLAHDPKKPSLDEWYHSLTSRKGPCCDGPDKDALHLAEVDWESQRKEGSQYRVRIPKNGPAFSDAMKGARVETEWVDVPDEAIIHEPNMAGETLVWPMYGMWGKQIRCFMPGSMI